MRLALTALVALAAAGAAAQDGVSQDGASVTEGDAPEEAESSTAAPIGPALLYTRELTNQDLAQRVRDDLTSLGSISIGFADRGLIINAVQMPQDPAWIIERPDFSYAVQETVDALAQAFRSVRRQFPDSAPARLNHISAKDGGYLRPHIAAAARAAPGAETHHVRGPRGQYGRPDRRQVQDVGRGDPQGQPDEEGVACAARTAPHHPAARGLHDLPAAAAAGDPAAAPSARAAGQRGAVVVGRDQSGAVDRGVAEARSRCELPRARATVKAPSL